MCFLLFLVTAYCSAQSIELNKELSPAQLGEELEYKLSWGWITLGRAEVKTLPDYTEYEGNECLEVEITGRSAGVGSIYYFDDKWGGTFDKNTFLPYYSYRDLKEGKYRLDEKTYFDLDSMQVLVKAIKKDGPKPDKRYKMASALTFDLVSGLAYARGLDYNSMMVGDTTKITGFFEKKFYDFEMVFHGREQVKTKVGKIWCWKIVPVMPDNKLFRGENSVNFWLSADLNRLPVKVEAVMFFGKAHVDLISYKNVKSGIDFE